LRWASRYIVKRSDLLCVQTNNSDNKIYKKTKNQFNIKKINKIAATYTDRVTSYFYQPGKLFMLFKTDKVIRHLDLVKMKGSWEVFRGLRNESVGTSRHPGLGYETGSKKCLQVKPLPAKPKHGHVCIPYTYPSLPAISPYDIVTPKMLLDKIADRLRIIAQCKVDVANKKRVANVRASIQKDFLKRLDEPTSDELFRSEQRKACRKERRELAAIEKKTK